MTTYSYSVSSNFPEKKVHPGQLSYEIRENPDIGSGLYKVYKVGDNVDTTFTTSLDSGEQSTLDGIIANHTPSSQNETVVIREETIKTGGMYMATTVYVTAAFGTTSIVNKVFPFPVNVLSAIITTKDEHEGDDLEITLAPDIVIGAITSDVSSSDTVITVSSSVIDNISIGIKMKLDDGTNSDNLGWVTAIDKIASTITVDIAATQSFAASTPTQVKMSHMYIDSYKFGPGCRHEFGNTKIGGAYIPSGKIGEIKYTNNSTSGSDKTLYIHMDLLR